MSLFSLIAALLLEQLHPLSSRPYLSRWLSHYAHFFQHHFNAGEHRLGKIAWLMAVLLPVSGMALLYWLLYRVSPLLAWAFNVLVLYLTMGFHHFSHHYTAIYQALRDDDLPQARALLADWRGQRCHELNAEEIVRLSIEEALLASHRRVFGVIVWFIFGMVLSLGPAGAVLYRLAQFLAVRWNGRDAANQAFGTTQAFGNFARTVYRWIEWLPLRMTASTFAIVGNFEDTLYCWRTQAGHWPDPEAGIVLASGAGALGVHLGWPIAQDGQLLDRPALGMGEEADIEFMRSAVGLVWRALILWIVVLLLLGLASLVG